MKPKHDLTGRVVGDVTVVSRAPVRSGKSQWNCVCRCGAEVVLWATHLVRGISGTCRHGIKKMPEYKSWSAMKLRVNNPNHMHYARYGGRGIKICDRWNNFFNFYEDMGPRPAGTSLDRFPDKNGDYEPGNCRWANVYEQQNNMRSNHMVDWAGELLTIAQLARKTGINYQTLRSRIARSEQKVAQA